MTQQPIKPDQYDNSHKVIRTQEKLNEEAIYIKDQGLKEDYAFKYLWAMRDQYTTPLMVLAAVNQAYKTGDTNE